MDYDQLTGAAMIVASLIGLLLYGLHLSRKRTDRVYKQRQQARLLREMDQSIALTRRPSGDW